MAKQKIKGLKLISGYHVTATEKAAVVQMLERGMKEGWTKIKHYKITPKGKNKIEVVIKTKGKTDYGKPKVDTSTVTLEILK